MVEMSNEYVEPKPYWAKEEPSDKLWWYHDGTCSMIYSFDKKRKYNIYQLPKDYPMFTKEQKEIVNKELEFWITDFFGGVLATEAMRLKQK